MTERAEQVLNSLLAKSGKQIPKDMSIEEALRIETEPSDAQVPDHEDDIDPSRVIESAEAGTTFHGSLNHGSPDVSDLIEEHIKDIKPLPDDRPHSWTG